MTDEPTLLSRVLAATGPDPALDGAIDGLVGHEGEAWPPRYTASLDAAVALLERVRPDWHVSVQGVNATWFAEINSTRDGPLEVARANGATPALALLAALLRSLGQ